MESSGTANVGMDVDMSGGVGDNGADVPTAASPPASRTPKRRGRASAVPGSGGSNSKRRRRHHHVSEPASDGAAAALAAATAAHAEDDASQLIAQSVASSPIHSAATSPASASPAASPSSASSSRSRARRPTKRKALAFDDGTGPSSAQISVEPVVASSASVGSDNGSVRGRGKRVGGGSGNGSGRRKRAAGVKTDREATGVPSQQSALNLQTLHADTFAAFSLTSASASSTPVTGVGSGSLPSASALSPTNALLSISQSTVPTHSPVIRPPRTSRRAAEPTSSTTSSLATPSSSAFNFNRPSTMLHLPSVPEDSAIKQDHADDETDMDEETATMLDDIDEEEDEDEYEDEDGESSAISDLRRTTGIRGPLSFSSAFSSGASSSTTTSFSSAVAAALAQGAAATSTPATPPLIHPPPPHSYEPLLNHLPWFMEAMGEKMPLGVGYPGKYADELETIVERADQRNLQNPYPPTNEADAESDAIAAAASVVPLQLHHALRFSPSFRRFINIHYRHTPLDISPLQPSSASPSSTHSSSFVQCLTSVLGASRTDQIPTRLTRKEWNKLRRRIMRHGHDRQPNNTEASRATPSTVSTSITGRSTTLIDIQMRIKKLRRMSKSFLHEERAHLEQSRKEITEKQIQEVQRLSKQRSSIASTSANIARAHGLDGVIPSSSNASTASNPSFSSPAASSSDESMSSSTSLLQDGDRIYGWHPAVGGYLGGVVLGVGMIGEVGPDGTGFIRPAPTIEHGEEGKRRAKKESHASTQSVTAAQQVLYRIHFDPIGAWHPPSLLLPPSQLILPPLPPPTSFQLDSTAIPGEQSTTSSNQVQDQSPSPSQSLRFSYAAAARYVRDELSTVFSSIVHPDTPRNEAPSPTSCDVLLACFGLDPGLAHHPENAHAPFLQCRLDLTLVNFIEELLKKKQILLQAIHELNRPMQRMRQMQASVPTMTEKDEDATSSSSSAADGAHAAASSTADQSSTISGSTSNSDRIGRVKQEATSDDAMTDASSSIHPTTTTPFQTMSPSELITAYQRLQQQYAWTVLQLEITTQNLDSALALLRIRRLSSKRVTVSLVDRAPLSTRSQRILRRHRDGPETLAQIHAHAKALVNDVIREMLDLGLLKENSPFVDPSGQEIQNLLHNFLTLIILMQRAADDGRSLIDLSDVLDALHPQHASNLSAYKAICAAAQRFKQAIDETRQLPFHMRTTG